MRFHLIRVGLPFGSSKTGLLKHPFVLFAKIAFWVGIGLSALGLALALIFFIAGVEDGVPVALGAVGLQGVAWLALCGIFHMIANRGVRRLEDLKQGGQCFACEITRLNHCVYINVSMHSPVVYAECIYINEQQQRCKVKSPMFLWENFDHKPLQATVYVDYHEPRRYAVEITRREECETHVDIDYT